MDRRSQSQFCAARASPGRTHASFAGEGPIRAPPQISWSVTSWHRPCRHPQATGVPDQRLMSLSSRQKANPGTWPRPSPKAMMGCQPWRMAPLGQTRGDGDEGRGQGRRDLQAGEQTSLGSRGLRPADRVPLVSRLHSDRQWQPRQSFRPQQPRRAEQEQTPPLPLHSPTTLLLHST